MTQQQSSNTAWYKNPWQWSATAALMLAAFCLGWYLPSPNFSAPPQSLRLSGYQFIDPLLACNINGSRLFPEDQAIHLDIQSIIDAHVNAGDLSKASVYFTDLKSGEWSSVYPDETFYPSSLGKIPIMMAYYEMAETDPSVLDKEITYTGGPDLNQTQDIPPAQAITPGSTYTVEQLIGYMIKDSDNNATQLLYAAIDQQDLNNIYSELGIPTVSNVNTENADIITPQQIGLLFRILYNATYISRDYSEKALQLMSESSFTQGLVAGVPPSMVVSNKLGLVGIYSGNTPVAHELHDCGIVYAKDPYVLCVMTKGSASLPTMESIVANISHAVYQDVENGQ